MLRARPTRGFDDPTLVSHAGVVLAMRLAEDIGLEELVAEHVRMNAEVKVGALIAGMIAGIDGMDVHRHGAMPMTFGGPCPGSADDAPCFRTGLGVPAVVQRHPIRFCKCSC